MEFILVLVRSQTDFEVGPLISYDGYPTRPPYDDQKSHRATPITTYELGDFTLSSQTAYVNWKNHRRNDLDFTAASMYTFQVTEPNELFSQELRLSSPTDRSEEHTSELQSLMRISYAVFCLKKKKTHNTTSKHI